MLVRRLVAAAAFMGALGCAGRAAGTVEFTRFDRTLDVDLAAMTRLPQGVYVRDIEEGTGGVASSGREVALTYVAYLPDGREVDRSAAGEAPATFTLGEGRVIRGWEIGVRGMRAGGVRQLVVPPRLAYGDRAIGEVPAGAVLVFIVRLERVR